MPHMNSARAHYNFVSYSQALDAELSLVSSSLNGPLVTPSYRRAALELSYSHALASAKCGTAIQSKEKIPATGDGPSTRALGLGR